MYTRFHILHFNHNQTLNSRSLLHSCFLFSSRHPHALNMCVRFHHSSFLINSLGSFGIVLNVYKWYTPVRTYKHGLDDSHETESLVVGVFKKIILLVHSSVSGGGAASTRRKFFTFWAMLVRCQVLSSVPNCRFKSGFSVSRSINEKIIIIITILYHHDQPVRPV